MTPIEQQLKIKLNTILLFLMLFQHLVGYSQETCVLAGDKNLLHFTDIVPDKGLNWLFYNTDSYDIDINQDNEIDFKIGASFYPSSMSPIYLVFIKGYNGNEVKILSEYYWNTVDTLMQNKAICDTGVWKETGQFSFGWRYKGDRYIGIRLKVFSGEYIYGWIMVSYGGNFIIKEYGCSYYTGSESIIFPNPTNNYVNIVVPNSPYFELKLFNSTGALLFEDANHPQRLDVSKYPAGVYFIRITTPSKTYTEKLVVTKQD